MITPISADPGIVAPWIVSDTADSPVQGLDLDLATVRSVLESAGGGSVVSWAAGMVVTGGRRQVVVTTDRGRGWLPPGVLLPADVVMPWAHEDSAAWEGLLDPGRVIVEYAAVVDGELTALASTRSAPGVAAGVPFVFADPVTRPRPDLVDGPVVEREKLQVSAVRLAAAAGIEDPDGQRRQALWIAHDAATKAGDVSAGRRAILGSLVADERLLEPGRIERLRWDALVAENGALWEQDRAARVDVRDAAVGRLDHDPGGCREFLVQSYATEAVLALRNPVARQALMDALYAWSMLLDEMASAGKVAA